MKPPDLKEKIKELPFLILLVLIVFVSAIFCLNIGLEEPSINFDQWSEFVIWAMGLWFGEQTLSKFSQKSTDKGETKDGGG